MGRVVAVQQVVHGGFPGENAVVSGRGVPGRKHRDEGLHAQGSLSR